MQKKSGDFSKNCSYLKLVMLLVLSAIVVLMFASFASADLLPVGGSGSFDINLTVNTGFNFSTGSTTASLASADIFYNGTSQPMGMGSQNDGTYRVWLASTNVARISGMGPNINLDMSFQVMSKDFMPSGSSQRTFPVFQIDDGIVIYTEKLNYVLIKVNLRNASLLRFSYKMNNQTDNQTVGIIPTAGCYAQTTKTGCFNAGSCFWDDHASICKDNTATGGGGSSGGGGTFATVMCSTFTVKLSECVKLNTSLCYSTGTSCVQNVSFDYTRGVRCEDITEGLEAARQGMCENVPLMSTCCSWTGTACASNATKTSCKNSFNNMSSGAMRFCEDAGNSSTACNDLKTTNYMPCKFDNSSTPERISNPRCLFDSTSVFGSSGPAPSGGGFGGSGFFDISTQAACQAASGNWKTFTYEKIDPLYGTKSTVTESKCEPGFGSAGSGGGMSCDQMCPACENNLFINGKNSTGPANTTTQAKNQCENSTLGICKWQNISKSPNGLGFCNFDKAYTDFGGSGNCQNDCFACFGSVTCGASKANCTWTNDQFNNDFNGDGQIDGWCDPKAYQSFNNCNTNAGACFKEIDCNQSQLNTGGFNATWLDSNSNPTKSRLAGVNTEFGFVGCVKVNNSKTPNMTAELCMYPGDEDGDGLQGCSDSDCTSDPACGFGMGGGFKPTVGGGGSGPGGPGAGPMNSSQMGFGADCFARDNTNATYCTSLSGCTWKQIGPVGLCDPLFDQQMGGGMVMDAPPTILGTDATGDAGGQDWLDIAGLGYHDGPQNMDLGIGLVNITHFIGCNKFHMAKSLNRTGKYYRFLDVDANASTGCNASSVGGLNDVSGYEYKVRYENNGTSEISMLYKCGLNANHFLNNTAKWVLVTKAQVGSMDFGCYIDDFMISLGFAGVHIQLINKLDISNPKQNIRVYVATANATHNDTLPVDVAGPFYYTPGSIDFKMEACNVPGADVDGDGYTSEQDPDCAKFKQYGFVPIESGPQCKDGIDNDGNELTDCADPGCKYDSFQCGSGAGFGYKKDTNDKTAPKTTLQQFDAFPDGAIVKVVTNEPTNASVEFYGTSSTCTTLNETVIDVSLTNSNTFDDYKPFHDLHLDNFGGNNQSKLDWTLTANTTYFFKTKTCDLSDNCAKSACQNFTTKASASSTDCSTCNYVVSFDEYVRPEGVGVTGALSNLTFTLDFGGDGVMDFNSTGGGTGTKSNYSVTQNTTITFSNPQSTEPWQITLKGLDIVGSLSSVVSNLSSTFLYNTSGGNTFMGMDGDKFDSFNQNYGVDVVEIKLPVVGDKLKHCEQTNLSNCVDVTGNATKIAQTSDSSTWQFPVTISTQFSLYQVEGGISFRSDKSSYACNTGEECLIYINVTNDNSSLKNLLYNISIGILKTGGINGTSSKFGLSTWNGTGFNFNNTVSSDVDGNLSLVTLKLDKVNLTDTAVQFRLNMSLFNFSKGGRFTFLFNATSPTSVNMNASYINNISFGGLQPYIDIINLTLPANSATIIDERTTFTYTLFSEFNTFATYNQTCYLRLNGTIVNSSLSTNGTSVTLSNNVTIKDGVNAWNVSCQNNETTTDLPGFSVTRTFTSGTPPTISVTSPTATTITNDNTTTITFTINDTGGINNLSTTVYFNSSSANSTYNASVQGTCGGTSNSLSCSLTINDTNPLPAGTWGLNITSKDNSGNIASIVVDGWIVDLFAPVLTNVTISDNYVANSTAVTVRLNATDNTTNAFNASVEFGSSRVTMVRLSDPIFWNATVTLTGTEGINTLTIRVFDNTTNVQTTTANYWIDTIAPTINITNPSTNGTTVSAASNVEINWTVTDINATSTNITVYDLQNNVVTSSTVNNQNGSVGALLSLQPGTYTASIGASDGAGNGIKLPSTAVRFTVNTQQNTTIIERDLNASFGAGGGVLILNSTGQVISGNAYFNQTLIKQVYVNVTRAGVNVTINITALGLYFNENKTNVVSLEVLTSAADALTVARSAGVSTVDALVIYKNMSQYIGDNNYTDSSGTKQWVPISFGKALGRMNAVFINDDYGKDLVILRQCVNNTVPTTTPNKTNACYTNGTAFVNIYVPHLSGAALADPQNGVPIINYTTPAEGALPDYNDSNLVFSVLVQSVDLNTSSCKYNISNAAGTALVATTSVTPTQVESGSTNYTLTVDTDTTLANASINNLTVQCASNQSNVSTKTQAFKVNDVKRPGVKTLTSSATTGATVTLTWTLTTNENATCYYGTSAVNISQMTKFGTTGAKSHTYAPSYTSDTSGTLYFACNDTSNNGGNGANYTNYSTYSVDVTEATTAAAASSGGGGSTSTTATTAEGASSTKKWITPLSAGATATMNILDAKIPVTSLSLVVANRVEKVEIKVTKLEKAPATAVPEGTGKVHSYLKVDTQNLKTEDVKSAKFKFKVEKTWLSANNYQATDVLLTRFDGVKWADLPTKSLGSTDGVETFEATSPGFSTFAIVGRTKVEAVKAVEEAKKAEEAAKEPEVKEEPKVEEKKEEKKAEAPVIPTQPKKPYTGWIVVLVIVVVAVVGYFVWQKKQSK